VTKHSYLVTLQSGASISVRRLVLIFPRAVMLEVLYFPIPTPLLWDPLSFYFVAIASSLVECIAPLFIWSGGIVSHIYSETIDLTILEAVPRKEVICRGIRTVFELALDTDINAVWYNILRPSIILTVSSWAIEFIPHHGDVVGVYIFPSVIINRRDTNKLEERRCNDSAQLNRDIKLTE
jgi:hypothetical protein